VNPLGWELRTAIVKLILLFGRYAILPVIAAGCALFMAWFIALDRYPIAALITLPAALPIATAAIVLGIGLLLPFRTPPDRFLVDEHTAPGLWAIWNEFDRASPQASRHLVIDPDLNASIGEQRQYLGLARRRLVMTMGMSLLIVLDERAVRAVAAHEVAHAKLQHTTGGANLDEFIRAAGNLFAYFDPDNTIFGAIADVVLRVLLKRVGEEYRLLSRQNELAADRDAAEQVGAIEMARALLLIRIGRARLMEIVFRPLEQDLLGAVRVPVPPLQRILKARDAVCAPGQVDAAELTRDEADSYHPTLEARLANLGFATPPPVGAALTSAATTLLAAAALDDLVARLDDKWRKAVWRAVEIH
jgi:Zn-dependent protease with chaperone function